MKIEVYRSLWGLPGPLDDAVLRARDRGYDGVEAVLLRQEDHAAVRRGLRRTGLPFKGGILTWNCGSSVDQQLRAFARQLRDLARTGASSITAISGHDGWGPDESDRYYEGALALAERVGLPLSHETHRNSGLFHPTAARRVIARFPEIRLTCDFSHWVLVCERLLGSERGLIRLCAERTLHIHARVGTEQAPQVCDVRAPEAQPYLEAFEGWWEAVWRAQEAAGLKATSLCPEFGPPPYQPTLPFTGAPVADLEASCDWMRDRQRARFKAWARRGRLR